MLIKLKDGRTLDISTPKLAAYKLAINSKNGSKSYVVSSYQLKVYDERKLVGNINVRRPMTMHRFYYSKHVGETGYYIAKEFRGTGLSYFLLYSIGTFVAKKGVELILASIEPKNLASVRVFKNCGGKEVGVFKRVIKTRKGYEDRMWFSVPTERLVKNSMRIWQKKGVKIVKKQPFSIA